MYHELVKLPRFCLLDLLQFYLFIYSRLKSRQALCVLCEYHVFTG